MACTQDINEVPLDIENKINTLMAISVNQDSIYTRVKETMKVQFDDLNLTPEQKATYIQQILSNFLVSQTQTVFNTALTWAEKEKMLAHELRLAELNMCKLEADTDLTIANTATATKELEYTCAKTKEVNATNIRDNGPASYLPDSCEVDVLNAGGTKYAQQKVYEANKYATLAKTYREAGIVDIATVAGVDKGVDSLSNTPQNNGSGAPISGLLNMQNAQTVRHTEGYDDNMRQHVANSSGQLMGQILAQELSLTDGVTNDSWQQWLSAVKYLNGETA